MVKLHMEDDIIYRYRYEFNHPMGLYNIPNQLCDKATQELKLNKKLLLL